jgi:signal transduction histidine kinase
LPAALKGLPPGVHDDVPIDGVEHVVLVRDIRGQRIILTLDIADLEQREAGMNATMYALAAVMIVLLGIVTGWGIGRLLRPLSELASRIGRLQPDRSGQRIEVPHAASAELVVIADALNDYLERNERFVERERVFINSASHELRTPIAVIAGAAELALAQSGVPAAARNHVSRIKRTAHEVEHLISLLLVLAKEPARLTKGSDRVALDQLLPEIIEDHQHLTRDKGLTLTLQPVVPSEIVAPLPIVQAAIGNLLRNAIENSDRGEITIRLEKGTTVVIEDPGHGMTPEEISEIYARMARGGGDRSGGGIGLDLISRLCEHLAWKLDIVSRSGSGTITTLNLSGGS